MKNGELPTNEEKTQKPVDLEHNNPVEAGFGSSRDDHKSFLSAYFTGPYQTAFRKRDNRQVEEPDGATLTDLVRRCCK